MIYPKEIHGESSCQLRRSAKHSPSLCFGQLCENLFPCLTASLEHRESWIPSLALSGCPLEPQRELVSPWKNGMTRRNSKQSRTALTNHAAPAMNRPESLQHEFVMSAVPKRPRLFPVVEAQRTHLQGGTWNLQVSVENYRLPKVQFANETSHH